MAVDRQLANIIESRRNFHEIIMGYRIDHACSEHNWSVTGRYIQVQRQALDISGIDK